MKNSTQEIKEFGAKVKKEFAGYYIYNGVNFTIKFNQDSCENVWWEINLFEKNVNSKVLEEFEYYNNFDTKSELVYRLYQIDKQISEGQR